MKKHEERRVSPTMSVKPSSQKEPQIEEEAILKVHKIEKITPRGGLSPKKKKDFPCHFYGSPHHYERDCRKMRRNQKNGTIDNKENHLTITTCDGEIIVVCNDACVSLACQ